MQAETGPLQQNTCGKFTSRIIKAGALVTDSTILLAHWRSDQTPSENMDRLREENPFGKASRSRLADILPIFRRRYLFDPVIASSLALLVQRKFPSQPLKQLLFFYAVRADALLFSFVTEELWGRYRRGRRDLPTDEVIRLLEEWVDAGRTTTRWGRETIERVGQGLLATLRDFGILEGAVKKRLNPPPLTPSAFAFLAFSLANAGFSGGQLLAHPDWGIFFLDPNATERLFIAADQEGLLRFSAAGAVVRIDFPVSSLDDYARFLTDADARSQSVA